MVRGMVITSVVVDEEDFNELCDKLGIMLKPEQVEHLKQAKHLPMLSRGTKTKQFFDHWDVETELMCVIVRGTAHDLYKQMLDKIIESN